MSLNTIRLALVDDHTLFRTTLVSYLEQQPGIQVIFHVSNVLDLVQQLKKNLIDVLITDLFMPHITGAEALTIIRNEYPQLKIIILTMSTDLAIANSLLDQGIHAYITKADEPEELVKAIRSAAENKIYRNKFLTEILYWGTQNITKTQTREKKVHFDDREKKIIQLLWEENSNKEIADRLFLSVRSIEKIKQDLKEKAGVKTMVGLLKLALIKKIIYVVPQPHNI